MPQVADQIRIDQSNGNINTLPSPLPSSPPRETSVLTLVGRWVAAMSMGVMGADLFVRDFRTKVAGKEARLGSEAWDV